MSFDFSKGGEINDMYFPALKPVDEAIKSSALPTHSSFFNYQPGNGTLYEVVFTTWSPRPGSTRTVMTLVNFRRSMEVSGKMDLYSLGYMREKLGFGEGDCYALIPLINRYFEELGE